MPLISPNFDVKSIIISNFGQGLFPKIAGKSPEMYTLTIHVTFVTQIHKVWT